MGKYDFNFDLYEDSTLAWIAQSIAPESTVLEFGAANGRLTRFLSEEKNCHVHIVEIDQEAGTEAAKFAEKSWIGAEDGDIERYRWTEHTGSYDYAVFADVLEHLRRPEEALKRCKAVLKPSGRILVSVPNVSHNSILIELMNDRFNYTPIGLLDNTHLKFFTRQSFIQMAEKVGYAVIGEKAKYIRVGETEIHNSYQDVPKEVFKYLANRDSGNVYQYLFTLANTSEYLTGGCERMVLLDGSSHYFLRANYEFEGEYSYRSESTIHVNPYRGTIHTRLTVPADSQTLRIQPLNCCCVLRDIALRFSVNGSEIPAKEYDHNGTKLTEDTLYFKDIPELTLDIPDQASSLSLEMTVLKYDFDDPLLTLLMDTVENSTKQIADICSTYEAEIKKKDAEFQQSANIYEKEIRQKDAEFQESVRIYEKEIQQKDSEFHRSAEIYEQMIAQKDLEFQKSAETYEQMIQQKDSEFRQSAETYEQTIQQRDFAWKKKCDAYEAVIHRLNERLEALETGNPDSAPHA